LADFSLPTINCSCGAACPRRSGICKLTVNLLGGVGAELGVSKAGAPWENVLYRTEIVGGPMSKLSARHIAFPSAGV
jgi:hypothetical protein